MRAYDLWLTGGEYLGRMRGGSDSAVLIDLARRMGIDEPELRGTYALHLPNNRQVYAVAV